MGSLNQPGSLLTLPNLTHVAKLASSVEQVIVIPLIDVPRSSAAWPTNIIIGSTTEVLTKRTREETLSSGRSGRGCGWCPKIMVRRGVMFLKCYRGSIRLISFVVSMDPEVLKGVLKHGVQAVLEPEPDLSIWDRVSIDYYLRLVFPTYH